MKWQKISRDEDYAAEVPGGMVMLSLWGEPESPAMVFIPCGQEKAITWIEEQEIDRQIKPRIER